jgi:hypothetical protein
MRLRFLSAQPAIDYYAWQVEVYLHNFLYLGYSGNDIDVVACYMEEIPESWRKIQAKFPYVRFFFYEDNMGECNYPPAIQSYMLEQHFREHPYLKDDAIFFHDCDFLFTKYFDFSPYLNDDTWYFSDTISYIGANYIKSKSEEVLDRMCSVIGIDRKLVEDNQENSGGAQKLMKNIDHEYWAEVYKNSRNLYDELVKMSSLKKEGDPYGIQVWTASMWSELWTAWKLGHEVRVPDEFDFCWATCPISSWDTHYFFHNAGVQDENQGMFFKADYIDSYPFNEEIDVNKDRCSYNYYNFMKSIDSCLV